ncbi:MULTISPECIES: superoxide dismutase [Ni] [Crateriforma]|uniref:Nickel-containing superoxide dismutase n=1 Tax=Crateriforma conspicua TaxID=2527996 RepID=A0A5C6FNC2_9PLAN|nr:MULTISPECIES: superoxide dismutase [Ni] [Crateriforma]TWU61047.1 Nickel-containing superoxide dismutase [Crateriforma conspicua]
MIRTIAASLTLFVFASIASAHCQVPCGIYGDQMRFEQMLEDEHTISKAQLQLNELSSGDINAQAINQMGRWTLTKEQHATRIQETIAAYFMAQRIKPDGDGYGKKLMAAHAVMIAAMKAKQSADPATAKALEKSIFDFYRAYEGKEPDFEHTH